MDNKIFNLEYQYQEYLKMVDLKEEKTSEL